MPNIKEILGQIHSVTSTQQITKAMKVVAASKLNKIQSRLNHVRLYTANLFDMLNAAILGRHHDVAQNYFENRQVKKILLVIMSSDRGLCGSFNSSVIKKTKIFLESLKTNSTSIPQIDILPIGRKAYSFFEKFIDKKNIIKDYLSIFHKLDHEQTSKASSFIKNEFLKGYYDQVFLVYNHFKSVSVQDTVFEQFLPLVKPVHTTSKGLTSYVKCIYEPSPESIMEKLLPSFIDMHFYKVALESIASENSARMVTMNKATDNATEMLNRLKLTYNRSRQASITQEISEIVSGAGTTGE